MTDFTEYVDLASERLGGRVLEANDEFFAPKENLLKVARPVFIEGKFTAHGKWMDGWETRRRRTPGYDWCFIHLGLPGVVRGIVVDTSFFKGNYPERFSLEGCDVGTVPPYRNEKALLKSLDMRWTELLGETRLAGDTQNRFAVVEPGRFTHLRLKIFPDGGVARLRVHGEVVPSEVQISAGEIDLAAVENGGRVIASSDRFFGEPLNLLMPGSARNMGEGWETRRRRGPGHDWVIVKLGATGVIEKIQVDTSHFKGNFPESCSLEACCAENDEAPAGEDDAQRWQILLPRAPLGANARHIFQEQLSSAGPATHVRLSIYPDGGVARLRLYGRAQRAQDRSKGTDRFNQLSDTLARKALLDCCSAKNWAEQMLARRPFSSADQLLRSADQVWGDLERVDWLEAFQHHPAIGSRKASGKQSEQSRRWSEREQSVAQKSTPETLALLAAANEAYRTVFGYVFLICATGKTTEEILKSLQRRLMNDPETELRVAAEEQRKITRLRLEKLLAP